MKRFSIRASVLIAMLLIVACRRERTVKIGWDPPSVPPDHYRVLVDGREVKTFPPPPIDRSCNCMVVQVPVEEGSHTVRVEACDRLQICTSSAEVRTP
jgi:hypothetical protein